MKTQLSISTSPPDSGGERSLACYQHSVQSPSSLMVWGCISDYGIGSLHIGKVPSLLKGIYTCCRATHAQHMQRPDNVFFGQSFAYFNKKMMNCRMLKWPAWSPDLPLTQKMCARLWQDSELSSRSCIRHDWDNIALPTFTYSIYRIGDVTHYPAWNVLRRVIKFKTSVLFIMVHFLSCFLFPTVNQICIYMIYKSLYLVYILQSQLFQN